MWMMAIILRVIQASYGILHSWRHIRSCSHVDNYVLSGIRKFNFFYYNSFIYGFNLSEWF